MDDVEFVDRDEEFLVCIPRINREWLNSAKIGEGGASLKFNWEHGRGAGAGKGSAPPFLVGGYDRANESLTIDFPPDLRVKLPRGSTGEHLPKEKHWYERRSTYVFILKKEKVA